MSGLPWYLYVVGALGLAVLMIVHEGGHFLAARAYGMRVMKFSIGFGPTIFKIAPMDGYFWLTAAAGKLRLRLWRHNPEKHGPTVYQVAAIPFLAYVQIAGMNPLEEVEPNDKSSYANASLAARIVAIFAGPFANYLFASVMFFAVYAIAGELTTVEHGSTVISVLEGRPAALSGIQDGDKIVKVADVEVSNWDQMAANVVKHPGEKIAVVVERKGERVTFDVTPANEDGKGKIGVGPYRYRRSVNMKDAAILSVKQPALVLRGLLIGLKEKFHKPTVDDLGGPKRMLDEIGNAAKSGLAEFVELMALLSAYLAAFNLLPFPALDGGRLMFLSYEAATRRRPNPRIEALIHGVGLIMLLGLMGYVTLVNDFRVIR